MAGPSSRKRARKRLLAAGSVGTAAALVIVACSSNAPADFVRSIEGTRAAQTPAVQPVLASFDPKVAHSDSYYFSRSNLGSLTTQSGLGIRFEPPPEAVQQLMQAAGLSQGPADAFLVQAIFRSGSPEFARQSNGDPNDFANFRWAQAQTDPTVTPEAVAYTIIKEIAWAKSFATDIEGPTPLGHFLALMFSTQGVVQASFAAEKLQAPDGLFVHEWRDGRVAATGPLAQDQFAMLWALAELADYTTGKYGWYAAPLSHDQAQAMADGLLGAIDRRAQQEPGFLAGLSSRDAGVALAALSAYAGYAPQGPSRDLAAQRLIPRLAKELLSKMDKGGRVAADGGFSQAATQGTAVQGLVYAFRVTGDASYKEAAQRAWDDLQTLWDGAAGLYAPNPGATDYVYSLRDVSDIMGAVNAMLNGLGVDVDQRFGAFFDRALNRSGLVVAEGPETGGDDDGDRIPAPAKAGGAFGKAPVFATEAVYHPATGQWELTDARFTTAYAMRASNQMFWMSTWGGKPALAGAGIPG